MLNSNTVSLVLSTFTSVVINKWTVISANPLLWSTSFCTKWTVLMADGHLVLIKITSENFRRILPLLSIHSEKHQFNSNQLSKKEKLKCWKILAKEKDKPENIIMQCIKSYGLLTHTWNTACNPGTLLFKIGCGKMERGSEKGDKDDHRKTMAPEKKNYCKK